MKKLLLTLLSLLALPLSLLATPEVVSVSLLTCGPTDEYVFYLYGHTAIRVRTSNGDDLVFNYGHFSPDQKNFIYNFSIGKPMYSLGITPMDMFLYEYSAQGRRVVEQELNLKEHEATALFEYLLWNAQPENRDYQYNFYFDNCATRPRDLIEEYTGGIEYQMDEGSLPTFRQAIRGKSHTAAWYTMGADLCLGWHTDRQMSVRDAAFLPDYLYQEFATARRAKDGEPLVLATRELLPQTRVVGADAPPSNLPLLTFALVALFYGIFLLLSTKKGTHLPLQVLRTLLYLLLTVGGVTIWFLALCSEHPHTFPNAHMLLFHPFYPPLIIYTWKKVPSSRHKWVYLTQFIATILFLILGVIQVYPTPIIVLALIILIDMWQQWRTKENIPTAKSLHS